MTSRASRHVVAEARPRFALISSPRSANTWLRRLLVELFALEELAVHTPAEVSWAELPERCVIQLHWPRAKSLTRLLDEHGFHVCVLIRHPLDILISILHFASNEPDTARWLDGAFGDERLIVGAEPCSRSFVEYARGERARALIGVSPQWWNRHATTLIRFEHLIADPYVELYRILAASSIDPVISIDEAVARLPFARMQLESHNQHFWQGQPGLWRRFLTEPYAAAIAEPYRRHARRFAYDLAPDPALTEQAARAEWSVRASELRSAKPAIPVPASSPEPEPRRTERHRRPVAEVLRPPALERSLIPRWSAAQSRCLFVTLSLIIVVTDVLGTRVDLIPLLALVPCASLISGCWRTTFASGLWAISLAVLLALPDGVWGTHQNLQQIAALALTTLLMSLLSLRIERSY
jgi:hypothetical protein